MRSIRGLDRHRFTSRKEHTLRVVAHNRTRIDRIRPIHALQTIIKDVVAAACESMVIGPL